jgi:hypothetical protein
LAFIWIGKSKFEVHSQWIEIFERLGFGQWLRYLGLLLPYKAGTLISSWVILALLLVAGSFAAVAALYFLATFIRRNDS